MKYTIEKRLIGAHKFVEITEAEYSQISDAKEKLFETLSIEEKFNLILENYIEYEQALLNTTLRYSLMGMEDWHEYASERHKINRHLINLLTTARLYLDQVPHSISEIYGKESQQFKDFRTTTNFEYDQHLAYRFIECLRNYVQHRGLPVDSIIYRSRRRETDNKVSIYNAISVHIDVMSLEEDGKFNKKVLAQLKTLGERPDVRPFIRQYIDSLGRINYFVQNTLESDWAEWCSTLVSARQRYKSETGDLDTTDVHIAREPEPSDLDSGQSKSLSENTVKRRDYLYARNAVAMFCSKQIVSNEVLP